MMQKRRLKARCGPLYGLTTEPEFRHRDATPQEQMGLFALLDRMGFDIKALDITAGPQMAEADHGTSAAAGKVSAVKTDPRFDIDPAQAFIGYTMEHKHSAVIEGRRRMPFRFGQDAASRRSDNDAPRAMAAVG